MATRKKNLIIATSVTAVIAAAVYVLTLKTTGMLPVQVKRIYPSEGRYVSGESLRKAETLLDANGIPMDGLRIYEVKDYKDTSGNRRTVVWADQFYKGLRIITEDVGYHFDATGKFNHISHNRVSEINLSTEPTISMKQAAQTIRERLLKSSSFVLQGVSTRVFTAELGFVQNPNSSYDTPDVVLAWRVKPEGAERYPYADIDAHAGALIRYDDGIRFQ